MGLLKINSETAVNVDEISEVNATPRSSMLVIRMKNGVSHTITDHSNIGIVALFDIWINRINGLPERLQVVETENKQY